MIRLWGTLIVCIVAERLGKAQVEFGWQHIKPFATKQCIAGVHDVILLQSLPTHSHASAAVSKRHADSRALWVNLVIALLCIVVPDANVSLIH